MRNYISQIGVYEKTINGVCVGYVLGFGNDSTMYQSMRANCIFKNKDDALAALSLIEGNTKAKEPATFTPVKTGAIRTRDGWDIGIRY